MGERLQEIKTRLRRIPLAVDVHPRTAGKPLERLQPLKWKEGHIFRQVGTNLQTIKNNIRTVRSNVEQTKQEIKDALIVEIQRASRDIELKVREGAGPVEFTLVDVVVEDSERHIVPDTERTFVINEGERIIVGNHDKVAVVWAKKYVSEETSGPSLPHREVVFQTR